MGREGGGDCLIGSRSRIGMASSNLKVESESGGDLSEKAAHHPSVPAAIENLIGPIEADPADSGGDQNLHGASMAGII
jgi:hypothetical protein